MSSASAPQHSARRLTDPERWVIYLSHIQPERLVVFVHGFGGTAVSTWQRFPEGDSTSDWWRAADMLFIGYDSKRDNITATAHRIARELGRFYPQLPSDLLKVGGVSVRPSAEGAYDELVVVGHSLGGVVVRRALCDVAQRWIEKKKDDQHAPRPVLLDARVRLFSPASAGFRAAGFLGLIRATPLWAGIEMFARRSSAYTDLQPGSALLTDTRQRTERLANNPEFRALRASVLWANPDDVVIPLCYSTDLPDDSLDGTTHSSVCKPHSSYDPPWKFVETGEID